jgi:GTP cyclohydrolase I
MTRVLIALGSNINPEYNMREAVRRLSLRCRLLAVSPVYETAPVRKADQSNFLNAVVLVETNLTAVELKTQVLQVIEQELGRLRTGDKNAPRTIDLDIALFGEQVLDVGPRHIPDPDISKYPHIAIPLADLAPQQRHPETGQTLLEIAQGLPASGLVRRPDVVLWPKTSSKSGKERKMTETLKIRPADYDAFRIDLFDVPEQTCTGEIECAVQDILRAIGEDVDREGLLRTPGRVARMYEELTAGYHVDPVHLINDAIFEVSYDEMVIVRGIDFYSLCEHHLLPFIGQAHVAYIPDGTVIGLSKIPRIVEMFARRLQLQERMTQQIAEFLDETLQPLGVAVVAEALHMCAAMRGVKKANARMVSSAMLGSFKKNPATRNEFFDHIGRGHLSF